MPRLVLIGILVLLASLSHAEDDPYLKSARDSFFLQFPGAEIAKVKEQSHDSANFLSLWTYDANKPFRTYKVEGSDALNKSIEAEFDRAGKLVKLDTAKVPFDRVPEAVRKTADDVHVKTKWAPVAECQKFQNSALFYTLKGKRGDKKLQLRITESGQLIPKSK